MSTSSHNVLISYLQLAQPLSNGDVRTNIFLEKYNVRPNIDNLFKQGCCSYTTQQRYALKCSSRQIIIWLFTDNTKRCCMIFVWLTSFLFSSSYCLLELWSSFSYLLHILFLWFTSPFLNSAPIRPFWGNCTWLIVKMLMLQVLTTEISMTSFVIYLKRKNNDFCPRSANYTIDSQLDSFSRISFFLSFFSQLFIHSLTYSFTHLLTHSFTHPLTHSLAYSLTHLLTHSLASSLTHSLTYSLTDLLTYSLTYSLTHLLTHSLTYSLTRLLTHSPTHSPTNSLTHLLTHLLIHSPTHTLTHSLTYSLIRLLTHSPTHSLASSLTHLLTHLLSYISLILE